MGQVCWVRFAGQGFVGFNAGGGWLIGGFARSYYVGFTEFLR